MFGKSVLRNIVASIERADGLQFPEYLQATYKKDVSHSHSTVQNCFRRILAKIFYKWSCRDLVRGYANINHRCV